jgi:hypothetical protein
MIGSACATLGAKPSHRIAGFSSVVGFRYFVEKNVRGPSVHATPGVTGGKGGSPSRSHFPGVYCKNLSSKIPSLELKTGPRVRSLAIETF